MGDGAARAAKNKARVYFIQMDRYINEMRAATRFQFELSCVLRLQYRRVRSTAVLADLMENCFGLAAVGKLVWLTRPARRNSPSGALLCAYRENALPPPPPGPHQAQIPFPSYRHVALMSSFMCVSSISRLCVFLYALGNRTPLQLAAYYGYTREFFIYCTIYHRKCWKVGFCWKILPYLHTVRVMLCSFICASW